MNFKGNSFSLGAGNFISGALKDGEYHILIKNNGQIAKRIFNGRLKQARVAAKAFSYADFCWITNDGVLQLFGGEFVYEKDLDK